MPIKSFSTAYGDGAFTTGGRGGIVVHVTNLNDSGAGSFREAMEMTVPRIIVFDVSGVINLVNLIGLGASNGDLTIAGQTSPDGGITISGNRIYMNSTPNVIVRHIRFKGGGFISNDSVTIVGDIQDHIWDHCSFGFGTDEGASWYDTDSGEQNNITVQRCLWNENSKASIIGRGDGSGGIACTGSYISNMFYNSGYRFPNLSSPATGLFDVINNVSWGITNRLIRGNGAFNLNHIGNYYNYGTRGITDLRTNLFTYGTIPQIYNLNNKIVGSSPSSPLTYTISEMNLDGDKSWGFFQDGGGYLYGDRLPSNYFTGTQHTLLGQSFTPLDADAALIDVSGDVGCNARLDADGTISTNLDTLDASALNNVALGNVVDKLGSGSYNVPAITSVSRPAGYYNPSKSANIPETWYDAQGLTTELDTDLAPSGYTWMEEFLNEVDGDIVIVDVTSVTITPQTADVQIGSTVQLTETVLPSNASDKTGIWSSDNTNATVDVNGLVTGITEGSSTITFTTNDGSFTDTSIITVVSSTNVFYPLTGSQKQSSKQSLLVLSKII